ncbi:MAG TPA: helix-turn-helix domain-containing protein [Methylomirabilota bacterium]|nr:helix-turn-helix domain-containing protein [Methylomirabilota bacterium]
MATAVMASVGAYLHELRARRGVSLEEVARTTRVAQRYLAALEADAFDSLPAPVFTRGFIRAYCQALGEPPEEALACYESREGRAPTAPSIRSAVRPRAGGGELRTRGALLVSFLLLVVLGMALFTVALVLQPRDRAERAAVEVPPDAQPLSPPPPAPAPRPTAARPPVPSPATPASPPAEPSLTVTGPAPQARSAAPSLETVIGGVVSPYRLVARTSEATWIRVRTEDGRSSEENVPAGEVREWVSDRPFVVTVGNAGGVSLELNGRTLPSLGAPGAVVPRLVLPPP